MSEAPDPNTQRNGPEDLNFQHLLYDKLKTRKLFKHRSRSSKFLFLLLWIRHFFFVDNLLLIAYCQVQGMLR